MAGEQSLHDTIEHLHGPLDVPYGENELIVVCLVRDGRPYVRSFVEHYRALGAKHLFFLDNGSSDGTVKTLREYDGVTVLRTQLPYKLEGAPVKDDPIGSGWTRECQFKQYLYSRFGGQQRWCLCADIDELFNYPYSDVIGLDTFLYYLGKHRYTAVAAQMIDMFPEEPLSGELGNSDEPLKERHRFCDLSNIKRWSMAGTQAMTSRNNVVASKEVEFFSDGIRETVFGTSPHLTKFPLVFLDGETKPVDRSAHRVSNARVADITCVLFHYKFLDSYLQKQVAQAVRDEHRYMASAKYKMYQQVLNENPALMLKQETAIEVTGVSDLLDDATLAVSEEYVSHVDSAEAMAAKQRGGINEAYLQARRRERQKNLKVQRLDQKLRREQKRQQHRDKEQEKKSVQPKHEVRDSETRSLQGGPGLEREMRRYSTGSGAPERPLADEARPLFVCGCQCSGTTAFADYANEHEEVMICQERYRKLPKREISRELFEFDKILAYSPEEIDNPDVVEWKLEQHAKILSGKDPGKLKWVGDKNPGYVDQMNILASHNPGARFVVLHRPVEEVAESFESRSKKPEYFWFYKGNGFEKGVELWNRALRRTKEFIQNNPDSKVLIVNYHDFFTDSEAYIPALSRFLEIEFGEEISKTWRDLSLDFESRRREKGQLTEEQRAFIEENADRETEAWILDRIARQWTEPNLYAREDKEAALSLLANTEAGAWKLEQQTKDLEHLLKSQRAEGQETKRKLEQQTKDIKRLSERRHKEDQDSKQKLKSLDAELAAQKRKSATLQRELENVTNSRTWRTLDGVNRVRIAALGRKPAQRRGASQQRPNSGVSDGQAAGEQRPSDQKTAQSSQPVQRKGNLSRSPDRPDVPDTPEQEREQKRLLYNDVEHLYGPEEIECGEEEMVVLCLMRNGSSYVRSFIEHYRALGARHIFFLDNGSTDGTVETLREYDGVTVLQTHVPYKTYQILMKRYLIERFGRERWSLYADVDELFDYPYSDVVSLQEFLKYLNEHSYTAVVAHMLDMFPEESLSQLPENDRGQPKETSRFYELSGIRTYDYHKGGAGNVLANEEIAFFQGGVQARIFGIQPHLTKHPLIFFTDGIKPMDLSDHWVANAHVADLSAVLLHYKLHDLYELVGREVDEQRYVNRHGKYEKYRRVLEENPYLRIKSKNSREFERVNDLVANGFLVVSAQYMHLVQSKEPDKLVEAFLDTSREISSQGQSFGELVRQTGQARRLQRDLAAQKLKSDSLQRELEGVTNSRTWRTLDGINRLKKKTLDAARSKAGRS